MRRCSRRIQSAGVSLGPNPEFAPANSLVHRLPLGLMMFAQSIPGGSRSATAKLLSVARSECVHRLFLCAHSSEEPLPGAATIASPRPPIEGRREKGAFATRAPTFFEEARKGLKEQDLSTREKCIRPRQRRAAAFEECVSPTEKCAAAFEECVRPRQRRAAAFEERVRPRQRRAAAFEECVSPTEKRAAVFEECICPRQRRRAALEKSVSPGARAGCCLVECVSPRLAMRGCV